MVSIGAIFISTYHTKQLNPWPNSSASRVVNYSQLSASKGDMQPLEGNPSTHGCLTSLRNKPCTAKQQNGLGNFQHQYLPELLVNACVQLSFVSCYRLCTAIACVSYRLCTWKPAFLKSGHNYP